MRCRTWQWLSVLSVPFVLGHSTHGAEPAAKPRVFLVPARAEVIEKRATIENNNVAVWIKRGGIVTAKVNNGLFFVDAGGTLEVMGNCFRIVVAEGGTLSSLEGNVVHLHRAKGAKIGKISASLDHVTVHETVEIRQSKPFPVTGTVRGLDGKTVVGVKVHAYTLGKEFLATQKTDAQGHFTFTTDEEVSSLVADVSPRWDDEKRLGRGNSTLELRQRFGPLLGWESAIAHGPWTEKSVVDLQASVRATVKMEEVRTLSPVQANQPVYPDMRFSPDRSLLLVLLPEIEKGKAEAQLWDARTGKKIRHFPLKPAWQVRGNDWAAFSSNGKRLALLGPNRVQLLKLPGGEVIQEMPYQPGSHHSLALSPGGELLALGGDKEIALWDLEKKSVRRRLKGHEAGTTRLVFSPDGKSLLSAGQVIIHEPMFIIHTTDKLRLWDLETGKETGTPPGQEGHLQFSSQGLLLSAGVSQSMSREGNTFTARNEEFVSVVDPSSKRELLRLKEKGNTAVFSDDGRLIITGGREGIVRFLEARTGQEVLAVPIPEYWAVSLVFSSDGKALATSRDDSTILLWDLSWDRLRVPEEPLTFTETEKDRTWKELSGDADGGYRAAWRLSRQPDLAVRFLKERLRPAPSQDLPIQKWLQDLGSPQFKVRQAALSELSKHGRVVESALRERAA